MRVPGFLMDRGRCERSVFVGHWLVDFAGQKTKQIEPGRKALSNCCIDVTAQMRAFIGGRCCRLAFPTMSL